MTAGPEPSRGSPRRLAAWLASASGPLLVSVLLAAVLALVASLPAVWWEPLHADEEVTLTIAPRAFPAIVDRVFVERGGAPLHFFLEHAALSWPGGLEGLRLPSLLLFLAALPALALVARELCGTGAALLVAPLLALAPMAVALATFGRMYTMLLAATAWATFGCLRAARRGSLLAWALAGGALGALVYVHPLAPLYSALALAGGLVWSESTRSRLVREGAAALAAYTAVQLPFFVHGLSVNRERYEVDFGNETIGTTHGRSLPAEIVHALSPLGRGGAAVFAALCLAGLVALARRRRRSALILSLWILVPILFFSLVPAEGTRFYDRYVFLSLPAFLLAAVVGCLALGNLLPRGGVVAGALLAGLLLAAEGVEDLDRLRKLHGLGLPRLVSAVEPHRDDGLLFASVGRTTLSRPPDLLARYVTLELPEIDRLSERSCDQVRAYLAAPQERRIGLWTFRGRHARIALAQDRLADVRRVVTRRVSQELLLVRTIDREDRRGLIGLGYVVRRAWLLPEHGDGGVKRLIRISAAALDAVSRGVPCREAKKVDPIPYGRPYAPPGAAPPGTP